MMKKRYFWVSVLLSLIAIVVSGIALASALPKNELCFDYQGAYVGVLSLLVTLLIGWNIYTVVDLKSQSIKESRKDYDHEISGALYHIYAVNYIIQKQYRNALFCLKRGIEEQNNCSNPVYLHNLFKLFLEQFENFQISPEECELYSEPIKNANIIINENETRKLQKILLEKLKK